MAFNFDSFAGAVWTLSEAIDETAILVGIPREALTRALSHHAKIRQDRGKNASGGRLARRKVSANGFTNEHGISTWTMRAKSCKLLKRFRIESAKLD